MSHTLSTSSQESAASNSTSLNEFDSRKLLLSYGILTPTGCQLAPDNPEFCALEKIRPPWVVKLMSSDIAHKSDDGFVALDLKCRQDIEAAIDQMQTVAAEMEAKVEGFLVEEMIPPGVEMIVSGFTDLCFGPLIMVGMGGVFVEVFKDISFRLCPIKPIDAEEMIDDLVCRPMLEGTRGREKVDKAALIELLLKIGGEKGVLMDGENNISELDLNPVIVAKSGVIAVDARATLMRSGNNAT